MAINLKSGTSNNLAAVEFDGALRVATRGFAYQPVGATIAAGASGTVGPVDVSTAGNVSFIIKNANPDVGWTGNPIIAFDQSDDQVSWTPLVCVRSDTSQALSTHLLGAGTPNTSIVFDAALEGVGWVRARVLAGTATGALILVAQLGGLPFSPSVALQHPPRSSLVLYGHNMAVGGSNGETLLTLQQQRGTAQVTPGMIYTVPAGRRLRIQSMVFTQVGPTTSTAATSIFRMRYNPLGPAVAASTPILFAVRLASPATATSFQQLALPMPEGYEIIGDGVGTFAFTVAPTYSTNAPTCDILLVGYEY